ncbi:DUF3892 domain-containing protein [Arthrobacter bambusae]|uniref:DUF3892 domain-containing protein n=1 Tax=Arthrobacter bambusae TaxID=1338426 RepID=UPI0027830288|nr:DUF3892 domain-containing protein [Arthrobacter bambusae]MDQ0241260.1 hypothetical protein [Arthrobacter bambusae]
MEDALRRIRDVEFAAEPVTTEHHPASLGTFWWVDEGMSLRGAWTSKEQAHDYVKANPGTVFVQEGTEKVNVVARQMTDPPVRWIETEADSTKIDNLLTLAQRHAKGLPNP